MSPCVHGGLAGAGCDVPAEIDNHHAVVAVRELVATIALPSPGDDPARRLQETRFHETFQGRRITFEMGDSLLFLETMEHANEVRCGLVHPGLWRINRSAVAQNERAITVRWVRGNREPPRQILARHAVRE